MYVTALFTHTKKVLMIKIQNLGGIIMPTGTKLEKVLASAKGLASEMKTFSMDTDSEEAKQTFNQLSNTMDNVVQTLQCRLDFVKQEEPQYNK